MVGRHRGSDANEVRREITELVETLSDITTQLEFVKQQIRTTGSRVLLLDSGDHDVQITGGELINILPTNVDQLSGRIKLSALTLTDYSQRL
jgi:hypothetical protein